jgi:hypothetical protein
LDSLFFYLQILSLYTTGLGSFAECLAIKHLAKPLPSATLGIPYKATFWSKEDFVESRQPLPSAKKTLGKNEHLAENE